MQRIVKRSFVQPERERERRTHYSHFWPRVCVCVSPAEKGPCLKQEGEETKKKRGEKAESGQRRRNTIKKRKCCLFCHLQYCTLVLTHRIHLYLLQVRPFYLCLCVPPLSSLDGEEASTSPHHRETELQRCGISPSPYLSARQPAFVWARGDRKIKAKEGVI